MQVELKFDEIPLCPHCDQPIQYGDYSVMTAHGSYYLACGHCAEMIEQLNKEG